MNQELIDMAEQATTRTFYPYQTWGDRTATHIEEDFDKEKFAALVAAAEREACAKVCEDVFTQSKIPFTQGVFTPETCVYLIRARGEKK